MSAKGIKSRIQKTQLIEDRRDDTLPEARRAPHWQDHGNAAVQARARPCVGPGVVPLAPFPVVPINTPRGVLQKEISRALGSLC